MLEVATKFAPTGILNLILLFLFGCVVFLATLNGDPFNVSFMQAFINEPIAWLVCLVLIPIVIPLAYRFTVQEQRELMRQHG